MTMSFQSKFRRLWKLVAPWPIESAYLGSLSFFMVASLYSLGDTHSSTFFSPNALIRPLFSLLVAVLTFGQLFLVKKYLPAAASQRSLYFMVLTFQSFCIWSWIVLLRNIFPSIVPSTTAFLSPIPVIRFLFTMICFNAFIGYSKAKLTEALQANIETLRIVENQRNMLLEYDEKTRRQIAEFLHDRVQSSLVTACFELQRIRRNLGEEFKGDIDEIINKLERLRAIEVRNASHTLAPAVGNVDLATSVQVMGNEYAPHAKIIFKDVPNLEELQKKSPTDLFLGLYRIIEQSFLNAIIHGQATLIEVEIIESRGRLLLKIENNGQLLPPELHDGLGTAIIDSWVRTLKGDWRIENSSNGRVVVSADFPI